MVALALQSSASIAIASPLTSSFLPKYAHLYTQLPHPLPSRLSFHGAVASTKQKKKGRGISSSARDWSYEHLMVVWDEVFEKCCSDPAKATRIRDISHRGWTKHGRGCVLVYQEVRTRPRGAGTGFTSKPPKSSLKVPDFVPLDWYAVYMPREFLLDPRKAPVEPETMSHDARPNGDAIVDVGETQHDDGGDINVDVKDDDDAHDSHLLIFDDDEFDVTADVDDAEREASLLIFDDDEHDVTADDDDDDDDAYEPPLLILDDDGHDVTATSVAETRLDEDGVAHGAHLVDATMGTETQHGYKDGAADAEYGVPVVDVTMEAEAQHDEDDVADAAHAAPLLGVTVKAGTWFDKDDIPDAAHGASDLDVTGEAKTQPEEGASGLDVTGEAKTQPVEGAPEVDHADAHDAFVGDATVGVLEQRYEVDVADTNGSVANHEKVTQVSEGMQNQDDVPSEDDVQLISQQMLFLSMRGMDVTRLLSLTTNFDFEADKFRLGSKTAMIDTKTMDAGGEDPYNPKQDELVLLLHLVVDGRPAFGADVVIAYRETNIVSAEEKDSWKLRLKYSI